ncbi:MULTISPECIES: polysaccharide deacetylase family protein [Paenibacillus]|jgi:peptidoglycan/xylan/chitin deacetylase (PgdA/CDA1 family)|uniref:Xylanase deacetylase n=2 Tax=Paenibacillus TaxID=44249 RepID=A0ABX2Z772_PAEPO|nr:MULTISPECIES: polysaccharide deacetylase family protein [Paenibacillus]ALA42769.1 xylanase deacetylase [Paenibacillus peoriae]APB75433.1 preprotein translocase subunit SecG [Paenibacillus polymyxa]MDR6776505.1 peptidoglycan/xylan/chitin deacetylase (PgdA/CDA1 family) [Paenibacillus peoriae]ODA07090.1 xylanase deacetylase [Paenibacillus polymyxa]OME72757.1 xylanase deacetylase [Paenibacillus peoriae]
MGTKTAAILFTACLLLSACTATKPESAATSNQQDSAASDSSNSAKDQSNVSSPKSSSKQAGSDDHNSAGKTNAQNDKTSESNETGAATSATSATTNNKMYHLDKAYNVIPNQQGTEKKVVLLTFDDGPKEAAMINKIIDVLDKHKAKAIFFVNGYRVKEHPELLKLIHDRGQPIGNHSWDHIVLKNKSEPEVKKQIETVQKAVKDITGQAPVFFRPPHGAGGDVGRKVAKENGLLYMTWSVGSLDWTMKKNQPNKTEALLKNVTEQLHPGSNILMHELPWTAEALDSILTRLEQKGYQFVDPQGIEVPAS